MAFMPRSVKVPGVAVLTKMFPDASTKALPLPRFSAWMPVEFAPVVDVEVMVGPVQITLATLEGERPYGIAQIALLVSVPFTLIWVFVALMTAAPLDCIRSPDWLPPGGLAVLLLMIIAPFDPFAV